MAGGKSSKTRGKLQFSRYFQELNEGDRVAIIKEKSIASSFPERLQGRTGIVESKRGRAYIVRIKEINREKRFIIEPIHLKKIEVKK